MESRETPALMELHRSVFIFICARGRDSAEDRENAGKPTKQLSEEVMTLSITERR